MKDLIIIGTGAFARELYWHAQNSIGYNTEWKIKGFLDGTVKIEESEYKKLPLPVLGNVNDYEIAENDVFTCAVGNPKVRKLLIDSISKRNGEFINIIHKTSLIQGSVKMGNGIVLCPYTCINDNAVLGDFVMVNYMSTIGHDVKLGDYSCLMGHVDLCGYVEIGKNVFFGSGARVLPEGKVGDNAFVGAGSVVLKNVNSDTKVFGNPARLTI